MPWKSDAQRRWGNSPAGHRALGDKGVAEFNAASRGKHLPEKVKHPQGNEAPIRYGERSIDITGRYSMDDKRK